MKLDAKQENLSQPPADSLDREDMSPLSLHAGMNKGVDHLESVPSSEPCRKSGTLPPQSKEPASALWLRDLNTQNFTRAFTLLEVMIATAIFFMAIFSILGVVSRSLRAARDLQPMQVDPSSLAAELSLTNRLEEGPIPDDMAMDFRKLFPGYSCMGTITEVATNGLFQVDLEVFGNKGKLKDSRLTFLLFRTPGGGPLRGAPGVRR